MKKLIVKKRKNLVVVFLILFIVTVFAFACAKDTTTKYCYECDGGPTFTGNYTDAGCYTESQWNALNVLDYSGNPIDKSQRCRKK